MIYRLLDVRKAPPHIVTLSSPIKMIGVSSRVNEKNIYREAQALGQRYENIKAAKIIQHKKEPWGFVAISKSFAEDGSWEYLMGDVVDDFEIVPEGLNAFEIPAQSYARFSLRPRWIWAWGLAMGLLKKYIYTQWLPASEYKPDNALVGDFEYHDQRSLAKRPEIDLYVAIRKKQDTHDNC